jgi:hypothetical protein
VRHQRIGDGPLIDHAIVVAQDRIAQRAGELA